MELGGVNDHCGGGGDRERAVTEAHRATRPRQLRGRTTHGAGTAPRFTDPLSPFLLGTVSMSTARGGPELIHVEREGETERACADLVNNYSCAEQGDVGFC